MITTVLFDLDGTLLPMDNDLFTKYYFKLLCKRLIPYGYEPQALIDAIWGGTAAMVKNDGSRTNEEVFWLAFAQLLGDRVYEVRPIIEDFYTHEFNEAKVVCGYNAELVQLVRELKEKGLRVVLATNPIFPSFATENRIRWAGLQPDDFELYTTYENIGFSKPNPEYYAEILRRIGVPPEECIMVGNDAVEDTAAQKLGMEVFLLTDCLLNKDGRDIEQYPHGDTAALKRKLAEMLNL